MKRIMKKQVMFCALLFAMFGFVRAQRGWNRDDTPKFQAYIHAGVAANTLVFGDAVSLSIGAKCNPYLFVGFETGLGGIPFFDINFTEYNFAFMYVPLAANLKVYLPLENEINPYFNATIGANAYCYLSAFGFYSQAGLGLDVKRFSLGAGYQYGPMSMGYLKLGVRLGR